jgi:DNA-binding MarR family transcriptional regulator
MPRRSPSFAPALRALSLFPRFSRWATTSVQARHLGRGLSLRQLAALGAIRSGATSPSQIARRLLVTPAVVTGLLDRLERHGYVQRETSSDDRRRQRLVLTGEGKAVAQEVRHALALELAAQLEGASPAELAELDRALDQLERVIGALEERMGSASDEDAAPDEDDDTKEDAAPGSKPVRRKRRRPEMSR